MKTIQSFFAYFSNLLYKWPEIYSAPLAVAIWYWSVKFFRWIDPMSKPWSFDELQRIIFALVALAVLSGGVFVGIKLNWPSVYKYYDLDQFEKDFKSLAPWQRVVITISMYLFLLSLLVAVLAIL